MTAGIRHDDLRRRNRAMVIAAVRTRRPTVAHRDRVGHRAQPLDDLRHFGRPDSGRRSCRDEGRRAGSSAARKAAGGLALNPTAATVDRGGALAERSFGGDRSIIPAGWSPKRSARLSTATISRDELVSELVAMLRRLTAGRAAGRRKPLRIVLAIQGITDAAARVMLWSPITPHKDIPLRRHARARIRDPDDGRERLQHDGGRAALARSRRATATTSSPSCSRTASAWGWC